MNRFNLSLPRGRVGLIWGLSLGLLMAWAALAVAQWDDFPKPLRPGETPPTFRVGEKAEAYWRGKFYPGVVTKVDSSSGWVNVEITADGKLQSAYVSPQAGFVRKVAGGATSAARTPSASRAASNKPTAAAPPPPKVYPVRTWSDDTGKFKIEARFVSKDDKGVQLKKTDGTTLTVPLAKLSKADQFFLESLLAEEKTNDASPTAATALVTPPADVDRQANWNARAVSVQAVSGWSLVPDPGPTLPPASDRVVAIPGLDPRLAMEANRRGHAGASRGMSSGSCSIVAEAKRSS